MKLAIDQKLKHTYKFVEHYAVILGHQHVGLGWAGAFRSVVAHHKPSKQTKTPAANKGQIHKAAAMSWPFKLIWRPLIESLLPENGGHRYQTIRAHSRNSVRSQKLSQLFALPAAMRKINDAPLNMAMAEVLHVRVCLFNNRCDCQALSYFYDIMTESFLYAHIYTFRATAWP